MPRSLAGVIVCGALMALAAVAWVRPSRAAPVPAWVLARPKARRMPWVPGNPCKPGDPGSGPYRRWVPVGERARLLPLRSPAFASDGGFDLLVHFHGAVPARGELVRSKVPLMMVALDAGERSGAYTHQFEDEGTFSELLSQTEARVRVLSGRRDAHVRRVAVSSWSAGYGAVRQILDRPKESARIDALILLDSLHTDLSEDGVLDTGKLDDFLDFARLAARGERLMVVRHSSIVPPGYASTTATGRYLVWKLGGRPGAAKPASRQGLHPVEIFERGALSVAGYAGSNARAHCAQLGLLSRVVREQLATRWRGPGP